MPDSPRTARDLLTQAVDAGVAPLLLNGLIGPPWAIRQDVLPQIAAAMRLQATGLVVAPRALAPSPQSGEVGVLTIPLAGIITPQGSFLDVLFGGEPGGLMAFRDTFRDAVKSPQVSAIILAVDSPGGLIDLVPETAAEIRAARGSKPIIAVANTQMASAAYWIASQADQIVITPSGSAGSIGVYRVHEDHSAANEEAGVAITYVSAGKFKTEGNPNEPLGRTAKAQWQAAVEDIYDLFVADVAAGRGVSVAEVVSGYGEGRVLNATRALAAGLADSIATYDEVRAALTANAAAPASASGTHVQFTTTGTLACDTPPADEPEIDPPVEPEAETAPADPPEEAAPEAEQDAAEDDDEQAMTDDERAQVAALLLA